MCICKYVDVVRVRMCADTYHKYLCQHASGRTGHQVSSFNTLHLVFESGSLTELRASHLARLAAPRALPVSAYPPNPWLYGEGPGMSTTWSSRLHVTLPIEQSTQTRPLESQTRMNILPRVLCLLGLNVSLYLASVSLQDATTAAALWSGVFPSDHFASILHFVLIPHLLF